jgi:sec-independent protein translocase protein TatA
MAGIGPTELILILIIIIILFGVGRVSKIFGELGSGIRAFKNGLQGPEKKDSETTINASTDEHIEEK